MATMEEIRNLASDAAQSAAKTARYVALVSKKRVEIAREQEKIRRLYAKLGKVYYKDYVTDEEPDEAEYAPICNAISDSFRRINTLKEELSDAKDAYRTDKEDEELSRGVVILPVDEPEKEPEVVVKSEEAPKAEPEAASEEPAAAPADAEYTGFYDPREAS